MALSSVLSIIRKALFENWFPVSHGIDFKVERAGSVLCQQQLQPSAPPSSVPVISASLAPSFPRLYLSVTPPTSLWYTTSAYSAVLESSGWFGDFPSSSDLHFFRTEVSTLLVVLSPCRWKAPFDGACTPLHLSCLCICFLPRCLLRGLL